jgi:hypothetical protein
MSGVPMIGSLIGRSGVGKGRVAQSTALMLPITMKTPSIGAKNRLSVTAAS